MARGPAIGLIGCGEMGAAIGAHLVAAGFDVATILAGRGAETRQRAAEAGLGEAADLDTLLERSEIVLSVIPPSAAVGEARAVAGATRGSRAFTYLDANAISPRRIEEIADIFAGTPVSVLDGGIVGAPPAAGKRPRLYLSGAAPEKLAPLDGIAFDIVPMGAEIGRASAFKMAYAALTKGTNALLTAGMLLAHHHDMLPAFIEDLAASQPELMNRAEANISRLPADAGRWVFEMEEIAATFAEAGLPSGFHEAAAEIMRILDASRFGTETRRTRDKTRSMADTIIAVDADRRG